PEIPSHGHRAGRAQWPEQGSQNPAGHAGVKDALIEGQLLLQRGNQSCIEEGEAQSVTGAVDDGVDLVDGAVAEAHGVAQELSDVRSRRDYAPSRAPQQLAAYRGMGLAELVVGLGETVVLGSSDAGAHDGGKECP